MHLNKSNIRAMYPILFVSFYKKVLNGEHAIMNLNYISKFIDNLGIFTKVRALMRDR